MTNIADMTKAEILDIWKGFVRNMSDQGAVVPFANEIESRVRNELLYRIEAAEKERDELRAKIEAMERQEPVAWRTYDGEGGYDYRSYADNENYQLGWNARNPNHTGWVEPLCLCLVTGAQPALSIPEGWKLVPIEPTQEMLEAGEDTFVPTYTGTPVSAPIDVYRAMLAAAPEAK